MCEHTCISSGGFPQLDESFNSIPDSAVLEVGVVNKAR